MLNDCITPSDNRVIRPPTTAKRQRSLTAQASDAIQTPGGAPPPPPRDAQSICLLLSKLPSGFPRDRASLHALRPQRTQSLARRQMHFVKQVHGAALYGPRPALRNHAQHAAQSRPGRGAPGPPAPGLHRPQPASVRYPRARSAPPGTERWRHPAIAGAEPSRRMSGEGDAVGAVGPD